MCPNGTLHRGCLQCAALPGPHADITNHWLPMWLAPNLITLLGLSALLLSYAVAAAHQPDFSGFAPLWLYASRCAPVGAGEEEGPRRDAPRA